MGISPSTDRVILPAGAILGLVELFCLAPSVHIHDAGELTAAAWRLGLAHPPGSPLYMILTKIFMTLFPFGHIAWRANLFSAIFSVGTFYLLAFWARRRGLPPASAVLVGALAALAPTLYSQALMAEVYTLQAFLLAAVFVSLDLEFRPEFTVLLWGLLLSCHISLAPLTPALLLLVILPTPTIAEATRKLLRLGLLLLLPLLLYTYIPIRAMASPSICWAHPHSLQEIWWYLSNANVRARSFSLTFGEYIRRSLSFGKILLWNLHLGIPLLLLGSSLARRRKTVILAWIALLSEAAFVILLDTAPLLSEAYGIASIIAAAVLAGLGLEKLGNRPRLRRGIIALCALSIIFVLRFGPFPFDLSSSFLVRDTAESVLSQAPSGAALFTQEDNTSFPLAYLVEVEGARPDLEIYDRAGNLFRSPWDRPLFRVDGNLAAYRKSLEEPLVEDLLNEGHAVVFTTPFLEYRPRFWRLEASGTVAKALLAAPRLPRRAVSIPEPRAPDHPGWMSRQILAMDGIHRATAELEEKDIERAGSRLQEATRLSDIAEMQLQIAQLALGAGALDTAEDAARSATRIDPEPAAAWQLRAHIALLQSRLDEASSFCRRALKIDPHLAQTQLTAGMIAIRRKDHRRAEKYFDEAIVGGIQGDTAFIDRALLRERRGEIPGAIEDLAEATHRNPRGSAPLLRLRLMARNRLPVPMLVEALCELSSLQTIDHFDGEHLREILLISAHAGAPDCIDTWIQPLLEPPGGERKMIAQAYIQGIGKGKNR